jgi:hypothetical protein
VTEKGEFELTEIDLDSWKSTFRRVLVNGPPLSGKTTSFLTFPTKQHILVAPGELGHSSVRENDDTKLYYWTFDSGASNMQYLKTWINVQKMTNDILSGKFGEVTTFGLDGLHKLYSLIMRAKGWTPNSDAKEYVKYHDEFGTYVNSILNSKVPYVVASCYDGNEAVEPGSKITQVFPDLPGKQAKLIMGMFPVCFHAERRGEGDKETFVWRLRATGKIQAAGMHLPTDIKAKFPAELPQDWKLVEEILSKAA